MSTKLQKRHLRSGICLRVTMQVWIWRIKDHFYSQWVLFKVKKTNIIFNHVECIFLITKSIICQTLTKMHPTRFVYIPKNWPSFFYHTPANALSGGREDPFCQRHCKIPELLAFCLVKTASAPEKWSEFSPRTLWSSTVTEVESAQMMWEVGGHSTGCVLS